MAFSSLNNHVVVDGNVINISRYEVSPRTRVAEVTVTGSGNGTTGAPVRNHPSWSFDAPLDDAGVVGMAFSAGQLISVINFVIGGGGGVTITNTVVTDIQVVSDTVNDVPRIRVTGEYGSYA